MLCAIQVNRGFSSDLKRKVPTEIQIIVDGTDSNTATVAIDYASRVVMKYAKEFGTDLSAQRAKIQVNTRAWYNPDLRSRNYNVPGVIAIVIMLTCLLLTAGNRPFHIYHFKDTAAGADGDLSLLYTSSPALGVHISD